MRQQASRCRSRQGTRRRTCACRTQTESNYLATGTKEDLDTSCYNSSGVTCSLARSKISACGLYTPDVP